jgi:ABC-type branched-subunit amino acid transport system ATPase component
VTVRAPVETAGIQETPALEARGVTVHFGGLVALSDVSISVPRAAIAGLVGPNGAGKTTLFGVVSGLVRPERGEVLLGGRRITRSSATRRARLGLARTFQHLELFMGLTVREHLQLAYRVRHDRRRLWTDLVTAAALRHPERDESERVDYLLELLGLTGVASTLVSSLPMGTSRRVEVGRALATAPSVLMLDEPSAGLDASETARLSQALRRVVDEEPVSLLIVEHDVAMVLGLSSTVTVLEFGICIAQGTPEQIRADPAVREAYLGDDEAVVGTAEHEPPRSP